MSCVVVIRMLLDLSFVLDRTLSHVESVAWALANVKLAYALTRQQKLHDVLHPPSILQTTSPPVSMHSLV